MSHVLTGLAIAAAAFVLGYGFGGFLRESARYSERLIGYQAGYDAAAAVDQEHESFDNVPAP